MKEERNTDNIREMLRPHIPEKYLDAACRYRESDGLSAEALSYMFTQLEKYAAGDNTDLTSIDYATFYNLLTDHKRDYIPSPDLDDASSPADLWLAMADFLDSTGRRMIDKYAAVTNEGRTIEKYDVDATAKVVIDGVRTITRKL